jgi:hypothetical protein
MMESVEFNSCGDVCKGVLTRPGGKSDNVPLVIMAGGWCYTKEIVMPWYGKFFEDLGCATLRFDYRRFGESSGEPIWRNHRLGMAHHQRRNAAVRRSLPFTRGKPGFTGRGGHSLAKPCEA